MTNEEELIDYAEDRGLIMLGWIHVNVFLSDFSEKIILSCGES